jgi:hypothetical protein
MASYDQELLKAARLLLGRASGQRGQLPSARIRRSISTTYYALFHFLLDETGRRLVGTGNNLRVRRRLLARTISHTGAKLALDKVRGAHVEASVAEFFRYGAGTGPVVVPRFIRDVALAFIDAYAKRQDADYNLNERLSAADARLLRLRVRRVIRAWRAANSVQTRDAKKALCILLLLKGQLRPER